jgi:septal ring factor EnvC (AmiA/AmiB activator)
MAASPLSMLPTAITSCWRVLAGEIQVGDFVAAGDAIGRLPLANQIAAGEERRALLYLELRKDGQPIDSTPWWPQR